MARRTEADRTNDRLKSLKGEISHWVGGHYLKSGATHEFLLNWRTEQVYKNENYKKLQQWAKREVTEFFDLMMRKVETSLAWTHVLNGQRVLGRTKLTGDNARLVSEEHDALIAAGKVGSAFCYAYRKPEGKLMFLPFREEDRQKELESGRLTKEDLGLVYDHRTLFMPVGWHPNGQACLTLTCPVHIVDDMVVCVVTPFDPQLIPPTKDQVNETR